MWQQTDSRVVRTDAPSLSDSHSSFTVLDGGAADVTVWHRSSAVSQFRVCSQYTRHNDGQSEPKKARIAVFDCSVTASQQGLELSFLCSALIVL